jgi:hypothetical protein
VEINPLDEAENRSVSKGRNLEGARSPELTRETAEQQRIATAMRVGSLAAAAHHAAGDLDELFPRVAGYMRQAGAGFERFSNIAQPQPRPSGTLISNLGRKQPAAIVAGVVLMGLGLSFYLRNSGDAAHHIASSEGSEGAYGIH